MSVESVHIESTYRPDLDVLFLRWLKPVSSKEVRTGYRYCLQQAIVHTANFWLLDLRSRGAISTEDAQWALKIFFPEAEKKLPGKNFYALLLTPDYQQFVDQTLGLEKLLHLTDRTSINSFYQEADALNWLKVCQIANNAG